MSAEVVVETSLGRLAGVREEGLCAFRGIPYARPPTGPLRFLPPLPPEPWAGVRAAQTFGASAPQPKLEVGALADVGVGPEDEDCLTLNVFTPDPAGRRPVMVWLHGGAFTLGSSSQQMYDVRPLALRGDVVMVTLNYRLGALGLLYLDELVGEELGTGNGAIRDQVRALEWVRDEIAAFGGDPADVTVFGESAGGMSVGTLLGVPSAQGLFRRAIAQSGATNRTRDADVATDVARRLLGLLELAPSQVRRLWELPSDAILAAQSQLVAEVEVEFARRAFGPVVDGSFLPRHPLEAIRDGLSRDVELLAGANRDEWNLFALMDPQVKRLDDASLRARIEARVPGHGDDLVEAYRGARPDALPPELFCAIETDRAYRVPVIRMLEAQSAVNPRTFAYLLTWESPLLGGELGACHAIDLPFVMGLIGTQGADVFAGSGPEAERLQARMMDAWLGFAREGRPGHADLPAWEPFDAERRATMLLGRSCELCDDPLGVERAAWDGIL